MAARAVRAQGSVFVCVGSLLVGIISVVTYKLLPLMLHPGITINGSRFDGSPTYSAIAVTLFAGVFLFGATGVASGVLQIRTGIKPWWLQGALQGIVAVMLLIGAVLEFITQ